MAPTLSILLLVIPNLLSDNLINHQIGSFHFPNLRAKSQHHHLAIGKHLLNLRETTHVEEARGFSMSTVPTDQAAETKTINSRL